MGTDPAMLAEELAKRNRALAGATGNAAAPAAAPAATPAPAEAPVAAAPDYLSQARTKLGLGMTEANLTPEEQAALAAEQLNAQNAAAAQPAAPAAGQEGFVAKLLGMLGLGGQ